MNDYTSPHTMLGEHSLLDEPCNEICNEPCLNVNSDESDRTDESKDLKPQDADTWAPETVPEDVYQIGSQRTICITGIPFSMWPYDVLRHLEPGVIVEVKGPSLNTAHSGRYLLITFLEQDDAIKCMTGTCERLTTLRALQGMPCTFSVVLQPIPTRALPADIKELITTGALSRILLIENLPRLGHVDLARLLSISGSRFHGILAIIDLYTTDGRRSAHVHCSSIDNAIRCYHLATRAELLKDCTVSFLPDPSLKRLQQSKQSRQEPLQRFFAANSKYQEDHASGGRRYTPFKPTTTFKPNPRSRPFQPARPRETTSVRSPTPPGTRAGASASESEEDVSSGLSNLCPVLIEGLDFSAGDDTVEEMERISPSELYTSDMAALVPQQTWMLMDVGIMDEGMI